MTKGAQIVDFCKSLWSDPFRWQLVKSVGIFAVAVYAAREVAAADAVAQAAPA